MKKKPKKKKKLTSTLIDMVSTIGRLMYSRYELHPPFSESLSLSLKRIVCFSHISALIPASLGKPSHLGRGTSIFLPSWMKNW